MIANAKRTILMIEDNELNREILCEILCSEYNVIQAENGKIGLDLLKENRAKISLILLDIQMPIMDGFEFLDAVNAKPHFANIPIIVTTSGAGIKNEIKCLEKGASDFVTKPYNTDIVLKRVESMIRLSEASALINKIEYDSLTGLYSKEFFFLNAERILESNPSTDYDMICSDIASFNMINDRYGTKRGDKLLKQLAKTLKKTLPSGTVCGRISEDVFAALVPHCESIDYTQMAEMLNKSIKTSAVPSAVVYMGLYRSVDKALPISVICNNALLANEGIKHQYGKMLAEYDENVRQKLLHEQLILDCMDAALEEQQLEVYYQPKHDLRYEKIGGAEALIRWIHPEFGFINPGEFIPLFEKNGFITKMDRYVLERVCSDIHDWLQSDMPVIPISINVSRSDFDDPDLVDNIEKLSDEYQIPHNLIHFEVTETAYTENPQQIFLAVKRLRELGFSIELDDFGSGYSSLNLLNDLDIDVLKLDMCLIRNMGSDKQKNILKHILSIANDLQMEVVAEGVETEWQADGLRKLGCTYAQGYFYSKPIPRKQFEEYINQ